MQPSILFSAFLVSAALAGCASTGNGLGHSLSRSSSAQSLPVGTAQDQVRQVRGEPFAVYTYPQGSSWFYNVAVRDMQRDRVDFDSAGLLLNAEPAWSRENFEQVQPQSWTSAQLQQHFGPPVRQERLRPSILESIGDAPPAASLSKEQEQARAASRNWIYGFREYNLYYIVTFTVDGKGVVIDTEIVSDPNNTTK